MKIRFFEHITKEHRTGILDEISLLGGNWTASGSQTFIILATSATRRVYLKEFLNAEDERGTLEFALDEEGIDSAYQPAD